MSCTDYKLNQLKSLNIEMSHKDLLAINQQLVDPLAVILILSKRLSGCGSLNEKDQKNIVMIEKNANKITDFLSSLANASKDRK